MNINEKTDKLISESDSKIAFIRYKNYQSLGDVTLEFGDRNRIILSAYNSVGKSAVARGLEVLSYYAYPKEYKAHIQDDKDQAEIIVGLQNGIEITRAFDNKCQYYTVKGMGFDLDTRINDNAYMVMEGNKPPLVVQKLINFAIEPETKQKLNIRYDEDGLLFSRTPGSTNYKTFYNAADLPELTKAIRTANTDRIEIEKGIDTQRDKRNDLRDRAMVMRVFDDTNLKEQKGILDIGTQALKHLNDLISMCKDKNELEKNLPPSVGSIDIGLYKGISNLKSLYQDREAVKDQLNRTEQVKAIDITQFNRLMQIKSLTKEKEGYQNELNKSTQITGIKDTYNLKTIERLKDLKLNLDELNIELSKTIEVKPIDSSVYVKISGISGLYTGKVKLYKELQKLPNVKQLKCDVELKQLENIVTLKKNKDMIDKELVDIDTQLSTVNKAIENLSKEVKEKGYIKCPNCNNVFLPKE